MSRGLARLRMILTVAGILCAVAILLIQSQVKGAAAAAMQGKGGTIKPVSTPTPAPRKVTPPRTAPTSRVNNTKTNQTVRSKENEAAATERTYWETIRSSTDPEDFKAYLKKYPNGQFADLANNRIRALEAAKAQPSPTPIPTPAPTPEPAYEWTKSERDLPAPVRLEFYERNLSFSVPSGWTRSQQEEGKHYLQINFRSPDSPQTNISIQVYRNGIPRTWRNGSADVWRDEKSYIDNRRNRYASQNVSAKLTDTEVVNHPTGRWHTFTADMLDVNVLEKLIPSLDAVYPDNVWEEHPDPNPRYTYYTPKLGSLGPFTRTRHSYAIREAGNSVLVLLYTAPIDQFDEKVLPSVMATLKMSGGMFEVKAASADSSVSLSKYEPEILIDGRKIDLRCAWCLDVSSSVSIGKHHITVRAKEHKPFEKDVFVGGWEDVVLDVKLERTASSTGGAKPK